MPVVLPAELVARVREAAAAMPGATAAFDADGTLWREDIGEAFLKHLVAIGWVHMSDGSDPYHRYEERCALDRATGFAFAAQLQEGLSRAALEEEGAHLAAQFVPTRLIDSSQALVALCRAVGLAPVIVSASPIEIVRAAAPLAGFSVAQCLGMTVREDQTGRLTAELDGPITYATGKVETLARRGLVPIALACGDSHTGDLAMLSSARVAVCVAPPGGSALAAESAARGWTILPDR